MDKKYITAEWARKTANSMLGKKVEGEIEGVLLVIEEAVKNNKMNVDCLTNLHDLTVQELRNRGFKVRWLEGDVRDPREHGYYDITW